MEYALEESGHSLPLTLAEWSRAPIERRAWFIKLKEVEGIHERKAMADAKKNMKK